MRPVVARTRRPRGLTPGFGGRRGRSKEKGDALLGTWPKHSLPYVQCLLEYVAREGHARVPTSHQEGNFRLGMWVGSCRSRRRLGFLTAERVRFLERLPGWAWNARIASEQDRLGRGFRLLQRFVEREGHIRVPRRHRERGFPLGVWVQGVRARYRKGRIATEWARKLEALPAWRWDARQDRFAQPLRLLRAFVKREGHARVPRGHVEAGYPLGAWLSTCRRFYREGRLSDVKVSQLEALRGWTWTPREAAFERGFSYLARFVRRQGHARVPHEHREDSYALGSWVSGLREGHVAGHLAPDRASRLEALPGWSWSTRQDAFDEGFAKLLAFVNREGHARVPKDHMESGYRLGWWVSDRRVQYARGLLPRDRAKRLQAMAGWSWNTRDDMFEVGLGHLRAFVKREGHARVPSGHVEAGYPLGTWLSNCRRCHRRGRLPRKRASRLEALRGWTWNPHQAAFERGFSHLSRFVRREGHARVPRAHREALYALGAWVGDRRSEHAGGRLDPAKASLLEALPGWSWKAERNSFEEGFAKLRAFVKREGHARVPTWHLENGFRLSMWVSARRRQHAAGKLPPSRARRLQALPGWCWRVFDAMFGEGLEHLHRFAKREGHARVPRDHVERGFRLGQWVQSVRGRSLTKKRERALMAIPGWSWNTIDDAFERGFQALRRFVAREGHARVPQLHCESGFRLGAWVAVRRRQHAEGSLLPDRARRLEALAGWSWNVRKDMFEEGLEFLRRFAKREGHARVPADHVESGFRLGQWVNVVRCTQRMGTLTEERRRALAATPGWSWNPLAEAFQRGLQHLRRFVAREEHALVPQRHREGGFYLGGWVASLRMKHKAGRLPRDRVRALEAVPGWRWVARAQPAKKQRGRTRG